MANSQVHQNTEPAFAGSMKCSPLQPHATPDAHSPMQLKAPFVWIGLNISNLPEMYQLCVHRIEYGKSQSSPLMFATKPQPLRSSHLHPGRASRQICWWAQLRWRLFDIWWDRCTNLLFGSVEAVSHLVRHMCGIHAMGTSHIRDCIFRFYQVRWLNICFLCWR